VVDLADGAIEFRLGSGGKQIGAVCPPSPGAAGRWRSSNHVWEIVPCPEVLIIVVEQMAETKVPVRQAVQAQRPERRGTSRKYALTMLDREVDRVRTAAPGKRNATLNLVAFRLRQLVATQALDRGSVEVALTEAALVAGLSEREVARSIRSGLEAGL
jgi:hypothetical protein